MITEADIFAAFPALEESAIRDGIPFYQAVKNWLEPHRCCADKIRKLTDKLTSIDTRIEKIKRKVLDIYCADDVGELCNILRQLDRERIATVEELAIANREEMEIKP